MDKKENYNYSPIKEELDVIKPKDEDDSKKEEEVPSVSFFELYRFASGTDLVYISASLLLSIIAGLPTPINSIIIANLMQHMVNYGISLSNGESYGDIFLQGCLDFLIYNCIIGALLILTSYAATVLINIAAYNQVFRIRQAYLKAALNQDFEYFDVHQIGDIASKMNDDLVKLEDGIGEKLATFVYYQSGFVSCVVMSLLLGWKLALLCLVSLPVTLFLVGVAEWVASKLAKQEAVEAGKAGNIADEVLSSIRTVYAFSGQQKELERYQKHLKEIRKINIKQGFFNGLSMGLLHFCVFCSYGISFWFGYKLMVDEPENYDVNVMIAVFYGVMTGSQNFRISSSIMEVFGTARGAGAQIFHLIDNVPSINPLLNEGDVPKSVEGNITLKNVVFHYPSRPDVPVLKGVNMNIKRGQSVALVGHSGCGKSTIIQLLSRYYDVVDGSVQLDGNDVRKLSVRWLRAQIGLVGQEPALFNTTVKENIRYGRKDATDADIEACAKQANAHQFIMKLPKGYDTLVGERGASLSGGQKQRVAIARALVRNPRVLLLDEATSALDTSSEAKVQRALDKAQEGRTTVVVAHRLSTIKHVDMIYVFKSGEIIESGNHEKLMQKKGHYYDMVMAQAAPECEQQKETSNLMRELSVNSEMDEDEVIELKQKESEESEDNAPKVSFWKVATLNAPEWKSVGAATLSSLLNGFATPAFAIVLGDFMSVLSDPNQEEVMRQIIKYAMIFFGVGLCAGISNFVTVYFYAIGGEYLTERLRSSVFQNLLEQDIGFYDDKSNSTGALCARLSGETARVQGATGQRIGTLVEAIGTFILALVASLYYEWRVGLVALTFVPFMIIIVYKEGRMSYAESLVTTKSMEESSKIAVEAVANVRTVASLGREDTFLEEYSAKLLPALHLAKRSAHWRGLVFGMSRGLFNFVYGVSLYYGGTLVVYHNVPYGAILKSSEALLTGTVTAAEAFAFAPNFQKGIRAAGRILEMLNTKSKIVDPDHPVLDFKGTGKASLQNVTFNYPTRPLINVLKNMNLDIEKGKTIALVGASGCGKSTVIQLLQRYYDTNEGEVSQENIPLTKLRLSDARQPIGFVQQEPVLFDRTIGENIGYGDNSRTATMDEIIAVAKEANIHTFITSLPLRYETNIGSKGTQLSGGQKQRIAIARALLRRPKMLLLDEATSALDTESEKVVQEALDAAKAGRTCVTIAHRLSTVRDADVICVLNEGQIAEAGTHAQLMDLKGLYFELNRQGYA